VQPLLRQYRRFTRFKSELLSTLSENDRDEVITDAKKDWGAQLHIPLSFRTIETKVPRAIAHRPRMLVLPRTSGGRRTSRRCGC
jgi:hypothetical protein